ncbi:hypothetical protein KIN20_006572 [Parelaphostrongylus tenuis]|uniref:Protein Abitram n=1 Tax=Parelaphostrongylus tenuis TaxID=148309 RepID=A0AAD5MKJ9_PARTN|nr:hypothetical protein KIN20_006572 [Parelaphostrongylus tenuis]
MSYKRTLLSEILHSNGATIGEGERIKGADPESLLQSPVECLFRTYRLSTAPTNDLPHLSSEVIKVDFGNTKNKKTGLSRNDHVVVGKGKKGGLHLQKETRLCVIHCKDGEEVIVRAGVRGVLVEVNERLIDNPDLVRTAPENQGYIAIIAFGAGKRKPDEFVTELPEKRVSFRDHETCFSETNGSAEDKQL